MKLKNRLISVELSNDVIRVMQPVVQQSGKEKKP
jgi:hypothetical protein